MGPPCDVCRDLLNIGSTGYYALPLPVRLPCRRCDFVLRLIRKFVPEGTEQNSHTIYLHIYHVAGERCQIQIVGRAKNRDPNYTDDDIDLATIYITAPNYSTWRPPMWPQIEVTRRRVARNSKDSSCIQFVRDNIHNCCSSHGITCSPSGPTAPPRRLVDIGSHHSLVYLKEDLDELYCDSEDGVSYSALSYCWGDPAELVLTKTANIEQHKRGIPREQLPQTIQDAMDISLRVGLRYLWIDCLCIIQDDAADWEAEASKMGTYYGQARLTIAASFSKDACSGIFAQRSEYLDIHTLTIEDDEGIARELDAQRVSGFNPEYDTGNIGPLGERAWTFQENMLSKRVAHFTQTGVIWECDRLLLFEDGWPLEKLDGLKSQLRATGSLSGCWKRVVDTYSQRKLTCLQDKLPALSGIAAAMHHRPGTTWRDHRYVAGLWEETLLYDLLWSSKWKEDVKCAPKRIGGPSWTWASVDAPISYFDRPQSNSMTDFTEITEVDCSPLGKNPYAGFAEGRIEIEGPVTQGKVIFRRISDTCFTYKLVFMPYLDVPYLYFGEPDVRFFPDTALDVNRSDIEPPGRAGLRRVDTVPKSSFEVEQTFLWMCMDDLSHLRSSQWTTAYGLVITELEFRPGYFTRVGYFRCVTRRTWSLDTLPASRRRICLV
ncbi:heterokaryon incompatibility protein-domain-containing protein [Hypoxylon sp. FL1150]|nr:heterokaryon incompatibility protein-domain-containing protein [Hypoxylon sp. FL1150]